MSVAIVGKLLGGLVVSGGGIAAITYMVINSSKNIYIYAISQEVVDNVAVSSEDNITEYKCQFDKQDYQCIVSKVADFDNTTKQTYVDDPDIDPQTKKNIVKSELTTAGTIYKILIKSDIKDWTKDKFSIDITPKTDQPKKYASLKPLFAIKSGGLSDEYTKTEYFVVQNKVSSTSTSAAAGAAKSTPTHTCSTSATRDGNVAWTVDESCHVYDFSSEAVVETKTLDAINFAKTTTESTISSSTTANKYYLVQLKTSVKANEVTQIKITTSGSTESFQSKEIIPAIYTTDKADGIFILTKNTTTKSS